MTYRVVNIPLRFGKISRIAMGFQITVEITRIFVIKVSASFPKRSKDRVRHTADTFKHTLGVAFGRWDLLYFSEAVLNYPTIYFAQAFIITN